MMCMNASDHHYDFGVKGHGQTFLKSLMACNALSFLILMDGIHICYNDCLPCADDSEGIISSL